MRNYKHWGGGKCLTSSLFNIQRFAYKEVANPYEINPFDKNYNTKVDISTVVIVNLTYYAQNNIPDYKNITQIPQKNLNYLNSGLTASDMSFMFGECNDLKTIPKLNIDTSQCISMNHMFNSCNSLISLDLSNFDTSKVTKMYSMFANCRSLITIDLSNFDTGNVTNMNTMFYFCNSLTSLDLCNFNTSNVTNMRYMFSSCNSLISLDLSNWDTSKVTYMNSMFYYCNSLEHIEGIIDMKSCTEYGSMFYNCHKLSGVKIKNPPADFESKTHLNSSQYEIVS